MNVAGHDLRNGAYLRPLDRITRKQGRAWMHLVEILDDCERLDQDLSTVERKRRDPLLRIDRAIFLAPLPAAVAREVHGLLLVAQVLQIERDADPIGRGRAEVAIKFHGRFPGLRLGAWRLGRGGAWAASMIGRHGSVA